MRVRPPIDSQLADIARDNSGQPQTRLRAARAAILRAEKSVPLAGLRDKATKHILTAKSCDCRERGTLRCLIIAIAITDSSLKKEGML